VLYTGTVHHLLYSDYGLMSFDVDASHLKTIPVWEVIWYSQPICNCCCGKTNYGRQENEGTGNRENNEVLCGSVETIIHDHLKISEVSAWWVSRNSKKPDCSRSGSQSHVISRAFGSVHVRPIQVCMAYCYLRWNLDSPLYTRVDAVETCLIHLFHQGKSNHSH